MLLGCMVGDIAGTSILRWTVSRIPGRILPGLSGWSESEGRWDCCLSANRLQQKNLPTNDDVFEVLQAWACDSAKRFCCCVLLFSVVYLFRALPLGMRWLIEYMAHLWTGCSWTTIRGLGRLCWLWGFGRMFCRGLFQYLGFVARGGMAAFLGFAGSSS